MIALLVVGVYVFIEAANIAVREVESARVYQQIVTDENAPSN